MTTPVDGGGNAAIEVLKATTDRIIGTGQDQQQGKVVTKQSSNISKEQNKQQLRSGEELLAEAEARIQQSGESFDVLDVRSLRRLANSLERKLNDNLEARLKYADDPEKFMDSEVELDAEIKKLMYVSGSPELYPTMVELNVIPKLLQLMSHENSDIVADVVELLADLSENDPEEDAVEEIKVLLQDIIQHNGIEILVERLGKLHENDELEQQMIHHILQLLSNIAEIIPSAGDTIIEKTPFLKLMDKTLSSGKQFYQNKGSMIEVVANTVAVSPQARARLGSFNTMECLLKALHNYKAIKGESTRLEEEEAEFVENLADILCYCLLLPENKTNFYNNEGVQLMILLIRKRSVVARSTIRLLSYALQNFLPACEMFVDHEGLRFLFAVFMSKLKFGSKTVQEQQELEALALDMISSLLQHLPQGTRRDRVASKFVENEFEKSDRLLEIFWDTYRELQGLELMLQDFQDQSQDVGQRINELNLKLQTICLIITHLWGFGDTMLNKRIITLLHQRGYTLAHVGAVLQQRYIDVKSGLGSEDQDTVEADMRKIEQLLMTIGEELQQEDENQQPITAQSERNGLQTGGDEEEMQQPKEPEPEPLPPLPPQPPRTQKQISKPSKQREEREERKTRDVRKRAQDNAGDVDRQERSSKKRRNDYVADDRKASRNKYR
eukprot:TRINITY_DN2180_c0_g2_i5.p1 TRINITY_DN2180_c0_g2~~TRINITY_DN2180_c0_g2_i5.p1  ORF type:complete len:758 (-),score=107.67 TRINITY_DN2180_c0_g2_i5:831-2840(-)